MTGGAGLAGGRGGESHLYEYSRVTETLGVDLAPHVVEVDALAYVAPSVLDRRVPGQWG